MQDQHTSPVYRGRFAPSPTGDLHFGSLIAAVGSYLQAKSQGGQWLIRIEDLDPPREVAGSANRILSDLAAFALHPDEEVIYQSSRISEYETAIQSLVSNQLAFWCGCSKRHLPDVGIYPGTCRQQIPADRERRSVRLKANSEQLIISDSIQGQYVQDLKHEVGDFIIRRGDGLVAYQLATALDDAWQGITEVVRGADLLDSTPRQVYLQQQLGLPTPGYAHLPVVLGEDGKKLSKRAMADPVAASDPVAALVTSLKFLGHEPPGELKTLDQLWLWAIDNWNLSSVPAHSGMPLF